MTTNEIIEALKPTLKSLISNAYRDGMLEGASIIEKEYGGDELSERRAIMLYGEPWLKRNIEAGRVTYRRPGDGKNAKKIFSKAQLRIVKAMEEDAYITKKY